MPRTAARASRAPSQTCNEVIGPAVLGRDAADQVALDRFLCELDGSADKSRLGANAVLGVSLAAARAAADCAGLPLHRYLRADSRVLPVPFVNLINGGKLTSNDLDFQEFICMPVGAATFSEALRMASECHMALMEIVVERYGKLAANTGDEGGFATPIVDVREALQVLHDGVAAAGYASDMVYALDCAATHLWDASRRTYTVAGTEYTTGELIDFYEELVRDYGIVSIEDPLAEDDWDGWVEITRRLGPDVQLIGDDLFVTNAELVRRGVELGAANAMLWKVNQIGTLSEAFAAAETAFRNGYGVCVSERSGETEDPLIADLVVALNAGQIKTGLSGARRAHGQVQPAVPDRGVARRRRGVRGARLASPGAGDPVSDRGQPGEGARRRGRQGARHAGGAPPPPHELAARRFVNHAELTGHGRVELRRDALSVAAAALDAVDPAAALRGMVALEGDRPRSSPRRVT